MDEITFAKAPDEADGLPRNGRDLRHTTSFDDAMSHLERQVADRGLDSGAAPLIVPLERRKQKGTSQTGRGEVGLRNDGRPLSHVSSFGESLDGFSNGATLLSPGELPIAIEIGAKLRAARLERGWTQNMLAVQSGVLQSVISEIEKGKGASGPNCSTIQKIATALSLRIELVPIMDAAD
jgi:DNA-binding XRE family transcriptional regulator